MNKTSKSYILKSKRAKNEEKLSKICLRVLSKNLERYTNSYIKSQKDSIEARYSNIRPTKNMIVPPLPLKDVPECEAPLKSLPTRFRILPVTKANPNTPASSRVGLRTFA